MNFTPSNRALRVYPHETSQALYLWLVQLGLFSLVVLYGLRFVFFGLAAEDISQLNNYSDITTLLAIGVVVVLFTMSNSGNWRLSLLDCLFIVLGGGFLTFYLIQGSLEASTITFLIFFLPLFMRWVRHVPRNSIKAFLYIFAIISSLFMIGEFLILNDEWIEGLHISPGLSDSFIRFKETYVPAGHVLGLGLAGDITRPSGILAYILTSGVSLGILSAFFVAESLVYRRIGDYIVTLLLVTALVLSTSTTGIISFIATLVLLTLMMRPGEAILFKYFKAKNLLLLAAMGVLVITVLWPILDSIYSRADIAVRDESYRANFLPPFDD